jgi:hypothetical protein
MSSQPQRKMRTDESPAFGFAKSCEENEIKNSDIKVQEYITTLRVQLDEKEHQIEKQQDELYPSMLYDALPEAFCGRTKRRQGRCGFGIYEKAL